MQWTPYGHWHMQKKADFENRPFCKVLSVSDLKNLETFEISFSGERGIRTPGTSRYNGFQDHRIRPLCHLSFFDSDANIKHSSKLQTKKE